MNDFKLNSDIEVVEANRENIFPEIGNEIIIRSISFTPESKIKLDQLRAKYKISRSAVIRILLEQAE